ncbi:hypothetical protein SAMN05421542_2721 [Chryseobacterium jejuense]|uniref:Uncharacterized protein n=1 Tax=Chryseobacterium jejuense TaxID=445960 RepID=A0A2X2VWB3_CHRJE|nr:hypothetical protein SAMN05421542_2721 [Chryseobacterium jejuense]SQB27955.1 Uncharacterised protein [Chryseobacterium jejuense]
MLLCGKKIKPHRSIENRVKETWKYLPSLLEHILAAYNFIGDKILAP